MLQTGNKYSSIIERYSSLGTLKAKSEAKVYVLSSPKEHNPREAGGRPGKESRRCTVGLCFCYQVELVTGVYGARPLSN